MSVVEILLRLLALALLLGYLFVKHRQRILNDPLREDPAKWTGTTIDVANLRPRVDRVRGDYLAAPRSSAQTRWYRCRLLSLAGRAVSQLSFFRDRDDTRRMYD